MEIALMVVAFAVGFVVSIYTWPWLRKLWLGATEEAERLRQKARDIEAAVRSKL